MNINEGDLRLTILGCFRYSLGRMTYMPSHCVMVIKNDADVFRKHDWQSFIKEIDECSRIGMDCDKNKWAELKEFAIEQLNQMEVNK